MNYNKDANLELLAGIDSQFISVIGPIGRMIIGDVKNMWRQKQWKGPSALRSYIKALSANIENEADREKFMKQANRMVFEAESVRSRQ